MLVKNHQFFDRNPVKNRETQEDGENGSRIRVSLPLLTVANFLCRSLYDTGIGYLYIFGWSKS